MALRALTPSGAAYCSECGAEAPADAQACKACGRTFEGVLEAVRCMFCGAILFRNAIECYHCGRKVEPEPTEEIYFKTLMDSTRKAAETAARPAAAPAPTPAATPAEAGLEGPALWQLSERFQLMLVGRKKRIEQMDALVARARRRIRMLEASHNPVEIREREELKRQIEEILVEREDILKIEEGIVEMERIYRNILTLQQGQLHDREEALKTRVEA